VGVEIIVGRRKDDSGVDLQQGLAQRVSLLDVPNLHGVHAHLRGGEGGREDRVVCCERGAAALAAGRGFEPPGRRIDR
jgi:hypothetical protein